MPIDEPPSLAVVRAASVRNASARADRLAMRMAADPWPDAWKKSHCSWWARSSAVTAEMRCAVSYFSTRYNIIALDSLVGRQQSFVRWLGRSEDAPDDEVVVPVVNQRWDAPIRVVLRVLRALLLLLAEIKVLGFVREAELFEDECDLPWGVSDIVHHNASLVCGRAGQCLPSVWAKDLGEEGELLSVRHGESD